MTHHHHDHSHSHHHEHSRGDDHDHGHSHGHSHDQVHSDDHGHDHSHTHEPPAEISFHQKMEKLLDHWLKHNTDHAESYTDWAQKAEEQGMTGVAQLLKEISDMTLSINKKFEEAAELIRKP